MASSKREFFHLGIHDQKKPDLVMDLRRVDSEKIAEWTPEQKQAVKEWVFDCESTFKRFRNEILNSLKTNK
jgi:hypothetical protein